MSRTVHSSILRQTDLTDKLIDTIRNDKVCRWRDGIRNEGLTVAASARIVGGTVANLYRWEGDSNRPRSGI